MLLCYRTSFLFAGACRICIRKNILKHEKLTSEVDSELLCVRCFFNEKTSPNDADSILPPNQRVVTITFEIVIKNSYSYVESHLAWEQVLLKSKQRQEQEAMIFCQFPREPVRGLGLSKHILHVRLCPPWRHALLSKVGFNFVLFT